MSTIFLHFFSVIRIFRPLFLRISGLLFLLFSIFQINAQNETQKLQDKSADKAYIASYDSVVGVKIGFTNEFDFFSIKGDDFFYDIRPNISSMTKLSVSYRHLTISYGYPLRFLPGNNDNTEQGKTKAFYLGFHVFAKHLIQELQVASVSGFYMHNTGDFETGWNPENDPYIQFPELKYKSLRGATGYKFNKNFSLRAHNNQTERQLRSCGSVIALIDYDFYTITNEATKMHASGQKSFNVDIAASLGYMYTFVLGSRFYASAGVFPGAGIHYTDLTTNDINGETLTKTANSLYRIAGRAGIGYNNRKFFAGGGLAASQTFRHQNGTDITTTGSRAFIQVFTGYRFNRFNPKKK